MNRITQKQNNQRNIARHVRETSSIVMQLKLGVLASKTHNDSSMSFIPQLPEDEERLKEPNLMTLEMRKGEQTCQRHTKYFKELAGFRKRRYLQFVQHSERGMTGTRHTCRRHIRKY